MGLKLNKTHEMLGRGGGVRGTWAWWMGLGIVSGVINQLCRSVERQEVEKLKNSTLFWLKKLEVFWVFFSCFSQRKQQVAMETHLCTLVNSQDVTCILEIQISTLSDRY